ncbi:sensor domain-containing diguanylate cyclase [Vibrio sp. TRT 21S02]|uniref:sensor domain-containing diguanylate cyclase n=1 Tax=Vibrio sp. TRT 21S02 TaxID=3418507 RepID=UPI003CF83A0E
MLTLEHIEDIYVNNQFTLHEFVLNQIGSYVFVKNVNGEYLYANQLTLKLFDTSLEELIGKTDHDFFEAELIEDILYSDRMVYETKETFVNEEHTKAKADGKVTVYRAIKSPIICSSSGEAIGLIGVSVDITDMVMLREQLNELAHTDDLTQLYNRRKMWRTFSAEFDISKTNQYPLCCISIDIDNFKRVNDTYGHDNGDRVIKALADLAKQHIRQRDACGRIGGEEFLVVLHHTTLDHAFKVAERLRIAFNSISFFADEARFSISCGITEIYDTDTDFFDVYRRSDRALYKAKRAGRNKSISIPEIA